MILIAIDNLEQLKVQVDHFTLAVMTNYLYEDIVICNMLDCVQILTKISTSVTGNNYTLQI